MNMWKQQFQNMCSQPFDGIGSVLGRPDEQLNEDHNTGSERVESAATEDQKGNSPVRMTRTVRAASIRMARGTATSTTASTDRRRC